MDRYMYVGEFYDMIWNDGNSLSAFYIIHNS